MNNQNIVLESADLVKIIRRFFTGLGAGIIGFLCAGIIIAISWNIVSSPLLGEGVQNTIGVQIKEVTKIHPLFLHCITLAVFLGSLGASIAYILLSIVIEEEYEHKATIVTHTFFGNLILLVATLPIYLLLSKLYGTDGVNVAAAIHILLVSVFAFFALEILNFSQYLVVNVYGLLCGLILFIFFIAIFAKNNHSVALFIFYPLLFAFVSGGNTLAFAIYNWVYKNYGSDFLNIATRYGTDYEEETYK